MMYRHSLPIRIHDTLLIPRHSVTSLRITLYALGEVYVYSKLIHFISSEKMRQIYFLDNLIMVKNYNNVHERSWNDNVYTTVYAVHKYKLLFPVRFLNPRGGKGCPKIVQKYKVKDFKKQNNWKKTVIVELLEKYSRKSKNWSMDEWD